MFSLLLGYLFTKKRADGKRAWVGPLIDFIFTIATFFAALFADDYFGYFSDENLIFEPIDTLARVGSQFNVGDYNYGIFITLIMIIAAEVLAMFAVRRILKKRKIEAETKTDEQNIQPSE